MLTNSSIGVLGEPLPPGATGLSRTLSQTDRDQVYVTPSGTLNLPHVRFIHGVLGAGRLLFTADSPSLTLAGTRAWREQLPVSEGDWFANVHDNVARLLGLGA